MLCETSPVPVGGGPTMGISTPPPHAAQFIHSAERVSCSATSVFWCVVSGMGGASASFLRGCQTNVLGSIRRACC
jgi:hypothetical protein